jgi:hypothetical protein
MFKRAAMIRKPALQNSIPTELQKVRGLGENHYPRHANPKATGA